MAAATPPLVELWRLFVPQQLPAFDEHWRNLDPVERQRATGFHREADRQRYVISQGSLRALLGRQLGIEPAAVVFGRGEFGKPWLPTHPALHFNTSHSGDWIVHGFSASVPVGVDVEAIPPEPIHLQDFTHVLTAHEFERLRSLPPPFRNLAFIGTWVRKEAYVKATGHGLSKPPGDICIEPLEGGDFGLLQDHCEPPATDWNWLMLDFGPGYAGCLAYPGRPLAVHLRGDPGDIWESSADTRQRVTVDRPA